MEPTNSPKLICFSFGIFEGNLVARRFKHAARQRGFGFTNQLQLADIIIGHSAGCYLLDELAVKSTILLVGTPSSLKGSMDVSKKILSKLRQEYVSLGPKMFFSKNISNLVYVPNVKRVSVLKKGVLLKKLPKHRVTIVHNKNDIFADYSSLRPSSTDATYLSLPGGHDDIWVNPDRYLDILDSIYE